MTSNKLVDWIDYPMEPICLSADATYALINDTIPLELHGDAENGNPAASLCIGSVAARRGNEGKVIFSLTFRSPLHETLFNQISKFSPMRFRVLGGSWPYKAAVGIKAWADGLNFPQQKPGRFPVTSLKGAQHQEHDRVDYGRLDHFCKSFGKPGSVWPATYTRHGLEGKDTEFKAEFMLAAKTLGDLDRLHLFFIEQEVKYRDWTKSLGQIEWHRSNPSCIFHVKIRGTLSYIAGFCNHIASK